MDEQELSEAVDKLDTYERMHLLGLIGQLIRCYSAKETGAVVLFANKDNMVGFVSINATPMRSAEIAQMGIEYLTELNMQYAPPKEMFN